MNPSAVGRRVLAGAWILTTTLFLGGACKRDSSDRVADAMPPKADASPEQAKATEQILESLEAFKKRQRYSVLTRDVLASIPDEKLEQALMDYLIDVKVRRDYEHEYAIIHGLSPGFRMMYSTWAVEAEVNNGGFNQFFFNSSGQFANDAVDGFRLIGAREHAKLTQEAIAIYEKEKQVHEHFKRQGTMKAFSESYKHTSLNDLDKPFFDLKEDVSKLRIAYIRSHSDQFVSSDPPTPAVYEASSSLSSRLAAQPSPPAARVIGQPGGVAGLDEHGKELWTVRHNALKRGSSIRSPLGPIVVAGQVIYGVGSDLITVSRAGRIERRDRMPGEITTLESDPEPGWLDLQLNVASDFPPDDDEDDEPASDPIKMRYRVGSSPPALPRSANMVWHTTFRDARPGERDAWLKGQRIKVSDARRFVSEHERDAEADATNPFHAYMAGLWQHLLKDEQRAHATFARAAATPNARWDDLLRLACLLDDLGEYELADAAHRRGVEGLQQAGVDQSRLHSALFVFFLRFPGGKSVSDALARKDAVVVDRLERRYHDVAPVVESAPAVWRALARWMEQQGRMDLAKAWRARAESALGFPGGEETGGVLDDSVPTLIAALATLGFGVLAFGLRAGSGRVSASAVCSLLLVLVAPVLSATWVARCLDRMRILSMTPGSLLMGEAAPDGKRFLASLAPTSERDRVAAWVDADLANLAAGRATSTPPPPMSDLAAALRSSPSFKTGLWQVIRPATVPAILQNPESDTPAVWLRIGLIAAAVGCAVGFLIGRLVGRGCARAANLLPGGPASFVGLSSLVGGVPIFVVMRIVQMRKGAYSAFVSSEKMAKWFSLDGLPMPHTINKSKVILLIAVGVAAFCLHFWVARRGYRNEINRQASSR